MSRTYTWLVVCAGLLTASVAGAQEGADELATTDPVSEMETVAPDLGRQWDAPPRIRSYAFADAVLLARANPDPQLLVQTNPVPPGTPAPIFDVGSMNFDGEVGWRVTLGYAYDDIHAVEASYLGVRPFEARSGATDGGAGSSFITSNVLIQLAPGITTETYDILYRSEFASYEVNLRRQFRPRWQTLLGFRYMEVDETFGVTTANDGSVAVFRPQSVTQNDLFGMQIGANWQVPVLRQGLFDLGLKLGLGGNSARQTSSTITDDLFYNESRSARTTQIVGFAEFNVSGGWRLRENMLLYVGYHAVHLDGVALAPDQFLASDFTSGGGSSGIDNNDTMTYHGLVTGLHFFW